MLHRLLWLPATAIVLAACGASDTSKSSDDQALSDRRPGGDTSVSRLATNQAFSRSSANLDGNGAFEFEVGDDIFKAHRVQAPGAQGKLKRDGLGPLFNLSSCQGCHILDSRGHVPIASGEYEHAPGMLIRLGIKADDPRATILDRKRLANGEIPAIPHPVYGGQFQDRSINGFAEHTYSDDSETLGLDGSKLAGKTVPTGEGDIKISWQAANFTYQDGTRIPLHYPEFELTNLQFGDPGDVQMSPRISSQMIGLGLIEAIKASDILQRADAEDRDNNGISGVANYNNGQLGRFGWKAGNPTLMMQNTSAFAGDIGITSIAVKQTDCTAEQGTCQTLENNGASTSPSGNGYELSDKHAQQLEFYTQHLAPPERPDFNQPDVQAGKKLFNQIGCEDCHRAYFVTGKHPSNALSNQTVWPYTDVLLHDMGSQLADNRREFKANGQEWRTAPLWGIGLTAQIVGQQKAQFLHDGRARNIEEAIVWHGCVELTTSIANSKNETSCQAGEAAASRDRFARLSAKERLQLIQFVQSL